MFKLLNICTAWSNFAPYKGWSVSLTKYFSQHLVNSWCNDSLVCSLHGPNPIPFNMQNSSTWWKTAWTFGVTLMFNFKNSRLKFEMLDVVKIHNKRTQLSIAVFYSNLLPWHDINYLTTLIKNQETTPKLRKSRNLAFKKFILSYHVHSLYCLNILFDYIPFQFLHFAKIKAACR